MGVYNSWDNRQLIDQLAPSADMLMWSGGELAARRADLTLASARFA